MHGKSSLIYHDGRRFIRGFPTPSRPFRYHSLLIDRGSLPGCLEITAETEEKEIMGVRHKTLAVEGVQFHPESIMTEGGKILLGNFLTLPSPGGKMLKKWVSCDFGPKRWAAFRNSRIATF